jgi:hypothetical protein
MDPLLGFSPQQSTLPQDLRPSVFLPPSALSFQVRSVAQQTLADWNNLHFSRSALIRSTQPRAWRTSLPASRYSFQRSVATVTVR